MIKNKIKLTPNVTPSEKEFNSLDFEKRLMQLKDSQDSINQLSAWCLKNRQYHKKIVASWLNALKKGLNLIILYLYNYNRERVTFSYPLKMVYLDLENVFLEIENHKFFFRFASIFKLFNVNYLGHHEESKIFKHTVLVTK